MTAGCRKIAADRPTKRQVLKFAVCLLVCFGVAAGGAMFTRPATLSDWYAQLQKPSINPPSWVFGPVWTVLYFLMALAAFLVWDKGVATPCVKTALASFAVQLALNAAWTPLFFGLHLIGWALADIIVLLAAIAATILAFKKVSRPAAVLLIPYLVWVVFATVLNARLYQLNS